MIKWFLEKIWVKNKKQTPSKKEQDIIEDNWKHWIKYELNTGLVDEERVLITCPSRIIGLIYLPKLENDLGTEWENYTIKRFKVSPNEYGDIYFGNHCFGIVFILNIIESFLPEKMTVDMKLIRNKGTVAIIFKINDDYALGIAEKRSLDTSDDEYVTIAESEIVWRKGDDFDIIKKGETKAKWNNWKVHLIENWRGRDVDKYAYHKNYLFEKFKEEGGLLLI